MMIRAKRGKKRLGLAVETQHLAGGVQEHNGFWQGFYECVRQVCIHVNF
jgi:hypothetical protein